MPRILTIMATTGLLLLLSGAPEGLVARFVSEDLENKIAFAFAALGAGASILIITLAGPLKLVKASIAAWPIILFVLLAGVSRYWSSSPGETLQAAVHLMMFAIPAICIAAITPWRELFISGASAIFLLGLLSIVLIPIGGLMVDPHPGALRGPWGEKNEAGMVLMIGALCFTALAYLDRKLLWMTGTVFLLGLVVLTKSTSAVLGGVVGIALMTGMELARKSSARLLITGWFASVVCGVLALVFLANPGDILAAAGEDTTLTGRSAIWPAVVDRIQEQPWLGHGYASFWTESSVSKLWLWMEIDFMAHNAHNGILETLLGLGIVGLSLLGWAYFRTLLAGAANTSPLGDARRFALPFLVAILIVSLSESALYGPDGLVWLTFIIVSTRAAMRGTKDQMPTSNIRANAGRSRTLSNQAFVAGNPSSPARISPIWIWKPIKQSAAENS